MKVAILTTNFGRAIEDFQRQCLHNFILTREGGRGGGGGVESFDQTDLYDFVQLTLDYHYQIRAGAK